MSAYREPTKPVESNRVIHLPVYRARRIILGVCLWALVFAGLVFVMQGVVEPFVTGHGWWKLPLALLAWPLFPWLVTRFARYETVLLGEQRLRRVGMLWDDVLQVDEIKGYHHFNRTVKRRTVPLLGVQTDKGEVVIAHLSVEDRESTLEWFLTAAAAGREHEIRDRVQREGQPLRRLGWYLPHVLVALALSLALGVFLFNDIRRRALDRSMEYSAVARLPLRERIATLTPIFAEASVPPSMRCSAGTSLAFSHAHAGDGASAVDVCLEMNRLGCHAVQVNWCAPFAALRDARAALDAGEAEPALTLLEGWPHQGPARGAIEVPALLALGRLDAAAEASARCLSNGDARDPATAELMARCRVSP